MERILKIYSCYMSKSVISKIYIYTTLLRQQENDNKHANHIICITHLVVFLIDIFFSFYHLENCILLLLETLHNNYRQ